MPGQWPTLCGPRPRVIRHSIACWHVSAIMSFLKKLVDINGLVILWNRYPDEVQSTKIIGERQFLKAVDLFTSTAEELTGKIDYLHVYLNFTNIEVELDGNKVVKTYPAALGPGFAAGTTDGPGVFGFQQGDTKVSVIYSPKHLTFLKLKENIMFGPNGLMPHGSKPTRGPRLYLSDVPLRCPHVCSLADQQVVETVERFAERTKPISSGLPKAQNCFAWHWRNVWAICMGGRTDYSLIFLSDIIIEYLMQYILFGLFI